MNNTEYLNKILGKHVGIYRIENQKTWEKYIGQSKELDKEEERIFKSLKDGECEIQALQEAYDKYGRDAFTFEVLLECAEDELDDRQENLIRLYYADYPLTGYNI